MPAPFLLRLHRSKQGTSIEFCFMIWQVSSTIRDSYRLSLPSWTDAGKLIDEIDAALTRKDYWQFRELVHALKGAAMMAGAMAPRVGRTSREGRRFRLQ